VPLRELVKTAARTVALVAAAPFLVSFSLRAPLLGRDRALEGSTQALALMPGLIGQYVRRAFLSRVLAHCHHTATVCYGTIFSRTGARLDENVYLGPGCHVGLVHIERDVLVAAGVHLPSGPGTHGISDVTRPIREQEGTPQMVRIGRGAWIGSAAVVLADVGHGTVVGAGSVVTKPLAPMVIAAGVPARVIKARGTGGAEAPPYEEEAARRS
jgi:acetyltransferase-like isoleucine patch superfamily enzyme